MADSTGWDWEERLDIDDSDLFTIAPSLSSCTLRQCSSRSRISSLQNPSSVFPRLLPGPAGAVQAAMRRTKRRDAGETEKGSQSEDIEMVGGLMDLDGGVDGDFQLDSWIYAMQYLGTTNNSITPIGSIRTHSIDRIQMVVGLVKSCTPNGLGDLLLTLKDQTGTISASIHNKALLEETVGSGVAVGCVLILKQVVVFSPVRSVQYLNITEDNIVKLVGKYCRAREFLMSSVATKFQNNGKREENKQMEQPLVYGLENHSLVGSSAIQETRSGKGDCCEIISQLNPKANEVSRTCTSNSRNHYQTRTFEQPEDSENNLRKISGDVLFCKISKQNTSVNVWKENLEPNKENGDKEMLASDVLIPEWTDEQLSELFADY